MEIEKKIGETITKTDNAEPFDEMHVKLDDTENNKNNEQEAEDKRKIRRPTSHFIFHPDGTTDIVEGPPSMATEDDEIFIIKRVVTPRVTVAIKEPKYDPLQTLTEKDPYIYYEGKLGKISEIGVRYGVKNLVLEKKYIDSKNRIWIQVKCAEKYVCVKKQTENFEEKPAYEFSENGIFECNPEEIKEIFIVEASLTYAMPGSRYKKRQIKDDDNLLVLGKGIYPYKSISKIVNIDSDEMFLLGDKVFFKISL